MGIWKFFIGGGWKWIVIIGVVGSIGLFVRDVYVDYQNLIATQIELTESNAELSVTNASNQATITAIEEQNRKNEINRKDLEIALKKSSVKVDNLENLLGKHNLEFLALKKPGLIERRINSATNRVFRSIECSTNRVCEE